MIQLLEVQLPSPDHSLLETYRKFGSETIDRLSETAKTLIGKKIIHVNSAADGGGVAELLKSAVLIERSLGIESHWYVIGAGKDFFTVTKKLHNLLQGKPGTLNEREQTLYRSVSRQLGIELDATIRKIGADLVVIHDPQPLAAFHECSPSIPGVLRLHIDLSSPNSAAQSFLEPFFNRFPVIIISNDNYRSFIPEILRNRTRIIFPAIDPLAEKNQDPPPGEATAILARHGINTSAPLIAQISRFDPWKDPLGALEAVTRARSEFPTLQLMLVGFCEAEDDPEAEATLSEVRRSTQRDKQTFLFSSLSQLRGFSHDDPFLRAVHAGSDAILQMSVREGFGLTITEAMWKEQLVIARHSTGAIAQITDEKDGFLIDTPEDAAEKIVASLRDENIKQHLGQAARHTVTNRFLLPEYVHQNLLAYQEALHNK